MPLSDWLDCSDAELDDAAEVINAERLRRSRVDRTPSRLAEMFAEYEAAGGDPQTLAAEAQRLADRPAPAEVPVPTEERTP